LPDGHLHGAHTAGDLRAQFIAAGGLGLGAALRQGSQRGLELRTLLGLVERQSRAAGAEFADLGFEAAGAATGRGDLLAQRELGFFAPAQFLGSDQPRGDERPGVSDALGGDGEAGLA
jgi:hypothetical protein